VKDYRIVIGINALNGRPVFLTGKDRQSHMHIIGTTGAGKSKLMEYLMRCDADLGNGACLIDRHGSSYQSTLKYLVRMRRNKKVILIDPNDEEWAVGLNYLEYDPEIRTPSSHASEVMKGIAKVFGGENTDIMPQLQRWERNALIPLTTSRLTLIELSQFIDPADGRFRQFILQKCENAELLAEWQRFDNSTKPQKEDNANPIFNRCNKFAIGEVRRIFGQINSTIDFREAMDTGKIILCNLSSNKFSEEEKKMLGIVLIDKIVQAGLSRVNIPEAKRRPFFFYLDEFEYFVSDDIAKALWELRKFKVFLILAHQELEQLRDESRKVYSAVRAETDIKVAFRVSAEDAELLVRDYFPDGYDTQIKRVIEQTKFWPRETTREVETEIENWSDSEFDSWGGGGSSGATRIPIPLFMDLGEGQQTAAYQEVSTSSFSRGDGSNFGGGFTHSTVPFYEYIPFKEVSSVQDYTPEELTRKYIAWLQLQLNRHAQIKIGQKRTVPIITPLVIDIIVRKKDIESLKRMVYSLYARLAREVDGMLVERRIWSLKEIEMMEVALYPTLEKMKHK